MAAVSTTMLVLAIVQLLTNVMDLSTGFVEQALHTVSQFIEQAAIVVTVFFFLFCFGLTWNVANLYRLWLRCGAGRLVDNFPFWFRSWLFFTGRTLGAVNTLFDSITASP